MASSPNRWWYSDHSILLIDAPGPGSFLATTSLNVRNPAIRMISTIE